MSSNVSKSKNRKIVLNSKKKMFFFLQKIWTFKNIFFCKNKKKIRKNAIPLVLPFEEISCRPQLSSPPHFELLWIQHKRDAAVGQARFLIGYKQTNAAGCLAVRKLE